MSTIPIEIDGANWRIKGGKYAWNVERVTSVSKAGEMNWHPEAHFNDLADCVSYLLNRWVREANAEGVTEILAETKRFAQVLRGAVSDRITIEVKEL